MQHKIVFATLSVLSFILVVAIALSLKLGSVYAQASNCTDLQVNLGYGATDSEVFGGVVTALQTFLNGEGYLGVEPTGYFGRLTFGAVKAFQSDWDIPNTGFVGPLTRAEMKELSCKGTEPRPQSQSIYLKYAEKNNSDTIAAALFIKDASGNYVSPVSNPLSDGGFAPYFVLSSGNYTAILDAIQYYSTGSAGERVTVTAQFYTDGSTYSIDGDAIRINGKPDRGIAGWLIKGFVNGGNVRVAGNKGGENFDSEFTLADARGENLTTSYFAVPPYKIPVGQYAARLSVRENDSAPYTIVAYTVEANSTGYLITGGEVQIPNACQVVDIYAEQAAASAYSNLFMTVRDLPGGSGQVAISGAGTWDSLTFSSQGFDSAGNFRLQASQTLNAKAVSYIMERKNSIVPISYGGVPISCKPIGGVAPTISVSSPSAGLTAARGQTVPIAWNAQNAPSDSAVALWLSSPGNLTTLLKGQRPTTGTYDWMVPKEYCQMDVCGVPLPAGSYKITAILYTPSNANLYGFMVPNAIEAKTLASGVSGIFTVTDSPAVAPALTFSANPSSVAVGQATTLSWSATNATSCWSTVGMPGWFDTKGQTSGTIVSSGLDPTGGTLTLSMACEGNGGSVTQSVTVTVEPCSLNCGDDMGASSSKNLANALAALESALKALQKALSR